MTTRRTLPPVEVDASTPAHAVPHRDPLLAALPPRARAVVVLEAGAFLATPLGHMLLRCLDPAQEAELRNAGADVRRIDRVAFAAMEEDQTMMLLSGDFRGQPRLGALGPREAPYGDKAQLFAPDEAATDAGTEPDHAPHGALWNDELWVLSQSEPALRQAVDRLEGRTVAPESFDPNEAYGEVYGRLDARFLRRILPSELLEKLPDDSLEADFHADASEDVVLTVDVSGRPETTRDLGKGLASLLALSRARAVEEGEQRLAELLDVYAVRLDEQGFSLDVAFPQSLVREALGKCAEPPPDEDTEDDDA